MQFNLHYYSRDCPVCGSDMKSQGSGGGWWTIECQNCLYSRAVNVATNEVQEFIGCCELSENWQELNQRGKGKTELRRKFLKHRDTLIAEIQKMREFPECIAYVNTLKAQDPNIIEVYAQFRDWLQENENLFPNNLASVTKELAEYEQRRQTGQILTPSDAAPLPGEDEEVGG